MSRYHDFINNFEIGANRWNGFIEAVHKDGNEIFFIDLPISPSFKNTLSAFKTEYDAILGSHRTHGADVVSWVSSGTGLQESDFYDQQHLLASGRRKVEPWIIKELASRIPGCGEDRAP